MTGAGRPVDILTVGESLGLIVPEEPGPLAHVDRVRLRFGGAESNVAIAAARLGARVTWVSRLGSDGLGDKIERTLRGEGVTVIAPRDAARPTGLMLKERPIAGRSRVRYYRAGSAASALSAADLPDELIASARVLHLTGITPALADGTRDAVRDAVVRARELGTLVSLDVNYRSALWSAEAARDELGRLLPFVDLLFAGLDEASLIDPSIQAPADAARLLDTGPQQVVIKLGQEGALAVSRETSVRVAAHRVDVVDSVGAGDAFVAAYLVGLLEDRPMEQCLELAAKVGALACTVSGDWEGAPGWSDLELLDSTDPVSR